MRRRRPTEEPEDYSRTPAGVGLAGQYGYSDAAKAHGQSNGGDIRRAYRARFEPLFRRDRQR